MAVVSTRGWKSFDEESLRDLARAISACETTASEDISTAGVCAEANEFLDLATDALRTAQRFVNLAGLAQARALAGGRR